MNLKAGKRPPSDDEEEEHPRKQSKTFKAVLNRKQYKQFVSIESYEFMYGSLEESKLRDSHISVSGHSSRSHSLAGTWWSAREKELFFEFLGRYGIQQVDRIKEHLPKKSVLEIMNYHKLLQNGLTHFKSTDKAWRLASYADVPEALEVDELAIHAEERLSKVRGVSKPTPMENTEDDIVSVESMQSMLSYWNSGMKSCYQIRPTMELHSHLESLTRELIRNIVKGLIRTKLHQTSISRYESTELQEDQLSFPVTYTDIYRQIISTGTHRPFTRFHYFLKTIKECHMRRVKEDEVVEESFDLVKPPINPHRFFEAPPVSDQPEVDDDDDGFIDYDDELVKRIFDLETMKLDQLHDDFKDKAIVKFMQEAGGDVYYADLLKRYPDNRYQKFGEKPNKSKKEKKKRKTNAEPARKEEQADGEDNKPTTNELYEITPEMVFAYNQTFAEYD